MLSATGGWNLNLIETVLTIAIANIISRFRPVESGLFQGRHTRIDREESEAIWIIAGWKLPEVPNLIQWHSGERVPSCSPFEGIKL